MAVSVGVAAFQIALASGAPWGVFAYGGQTSGKLPVRLRMTSAGSVLVYAAQCAFYASVSGILPVTLPPMTVLWISWIFFALLSIGTLMNAISRSRKERALWTPIVALSALCALIVAVNL